MISKKHKQNPYNKVIFHVKPTTLLQNLRQGKYKVFLEGIDQENYNENDEQLAEVLRRIYLHDGMFTMMRFEGDSNPWPQFNLNTRFELGPFVGFETRYGYIRSEIEVQFEDEQFESTFVQMKHKPATISLYGGNTETPMWSLDTRSDDDGEIYVNVRVRNVDLNTHQLRRHRICKYSELYRSNKIHKFVVEFNIKERLFHCFLDDELVYKSTTKRFTKYDTNGIAVLFFGMYATDMTEQEESVSFRNIKVLLCNESYAETKKKMWKLAKILFLEEGEDANNDACEDDDDFFY